MDMDVAPHARAPTGVRPEQVRGPGSSSSAWEPPPHPCYSEAVRAAIAEQGVLAIGSWPNRITLGHATDVPPASRKRECDAAFGGQRLDELSSLDEAPGEATGGGGGGLPPQSSLEEAGGLQDWSGLQETILEAHLLAAELSLSASVLEPLVQALGGGASAPQQGLTFGAGSGDYSFEALMSDALALEDPSPDGGRLAYAGV